MDNPASNHIHRPIRGVELRWPASAIWRPDEPAVRTIVLADLKDAVKKGVDDFKAAPSHVLFLCMIYPVVGLIAARIAFGYDMLPLVYPIVAGFALIGPMLAIGLYEMSRRREQGLDTAVHHAFDVLKSPSIGAIGRLSLFILAIFLAWMALAQIMYQQTMGGWTPTSLREFFSHIFTTPAGHQLIIAGNGVGFLIALFVLTISVVSFPMLVDRNVTAATAVRTSIRAVIENPLTMALWGLFVAVALIAGSLPFFFGLAVVFPVLGHSTWHLYRKVVER